MALVSMYIHFNVLTIFSKFVIKNFLNIELKGESQEYDKMVNQSL